MWSRTPFHAARRRAPTQGPVDGLDIIVKIPYI
jgi:hypothetical protein